MDLNLEHQLRLKTDTDYSGLYEWAINEIDPTGNQISQDQIPWPWSLYLTGTSCIATAALEIETEVADDDNPKPSAVITQNDIIRINLNSRETVLSMFGTGRKIEKIELAVRPTYDADGKTGCTAWGCPSYNREVDFSTETTDDCINFTLTVRQEVFKRYQNLLLMGLIDEITFRVDRVSGFYSEWSPSIGTDQIKVLTRETGQSVDLTANPDMKPPRLGEVQRASLYFNKNLKLGSYSMDHAD